MQEVAEWDARRNPNTRPLPHTGDRFALKSISRALAAKANTRVLVPMLCAFEAANEAVLQGPADALDAPVTIASAGDEVPLFVVLVDFENLC